MILFLALILIFTPSVLMMLDEVESDADVIQWMMNQPLQFVIFLSESIKMGINLLGLSVAIEAINIIRNL